MVLVATQVKRRRGTNDENDAFAGAEGEITVDLTNKELRVHDGSGKTGGFRIGRRTDRTNCITEIPQDIKIELSNGTITLKSGSKVYIPNGSGVFNTITIASDISISAIANRKTTILYRNGALQRMNTEYCYSGANAPTPAAATAIWYDTTNNVIKSTYDTGTTWSTDNMSLPVCVATETSAGFTSIDQVFNGFGFIGSTVFALPNVKGLIPNGRNTDGTLKNNFFTVNNVLITTDVSGATGALEYYINGSGIYRANIGLFIYDEYKNIFVNSSGVQQTITALDLNAYRTGGQVSSFAPKQVFRALNYSDTQYMAHQAMPSSRYVELTLGTSGSSYTAPADGFYVIEQEISATNGFISIVNTTNHTAKTLYAPSGFSVFDMLAVSKGDIVKIIYNNIGDTEIFDFVYANGSK